MASPREANAIAKKQLALRDHLWPARQDYLWHRKANRGYETIPKTMPFILKIMDELGNGSPLSSTYLALWCATWDNSYVAISKPIELAIAAGFGGQRAEYTWATRMRKLQALHFIDTKAGKAGRMSHAIIWNPHLVIRYHHDVAKTPGLLEASFTGLIERAMEIGATDMLRTFPANMSAAGDGPVEALVRQTAKAGALAATAEAATTRAKNSPTEEATT